MASVKKTLMQRFCEKVKLPDDPDGCWEWTGTKVTGGYGSLTAERRTRYAHRIAYESFVGEIADGHEIDHLCANPSCCNPAHLDAVTPRTNKLRSNGFAGINSRKTHCVLGHPLSGDNIYIYRGRRSCRVCNSSRIRAWRKQRKERISTY